MVFCERGEGARAHRKFLGRGWVHRFGDGFAGVAFDPGAAHIGTTGVRHADGGVSFRFTCPAAGCTHRPVVREEKLGEFLLSLAALRAGNPDAPVALNVGTLP
jgi:hypothetical protein